MARKPAQDAGYGAYDDGESLSANPFRFDEEHAEWEAWRTGWINAEADARETATEDPYAHAIIIRDPDGSIDIA